MAECFGILLFCNSFVNDGLRIITESRDFASILPKLFKKAFGLSFDVLPEQDSVGKQNFQINQPEKITQIMQSYGFDPIRTLSLHINLSVLEDECCKAAFLRGAFLAGGSVTDPDKGYHLEVATTHASVAREGHALMQEVLPVSPKTAARGGTQVLYLKQSEQISDYLTFLGAPIASMGIMEARLEKELNNRQQEIDIKQEELDLVTKRLDEISQNLDFETNLEEYYKVFCAYRREDTYSNANFISDGVTSSVPVKSFFFSSYF